ncbi:MAG: hypothetical protein GEV07_27695 [Streptosporangiales bacterium]|nr:hypothetical protein [Streptosporangiales bacterium]
MSAPLLLGIDLGTTGVKAVLVDAGTGVPVSLGSVDYPSSTTPDGGHEQDTEDWWAATVTAVRAAVDRSDGRPVEAVGLSGHMHAVTLIGADDQAMRPALTWADRRASGEAADLRKQPQFVRRCGNPVVEAFSAPKVAWIARHEPDALAAAVRMVLPKDVLRHRLTGTWGTDTSDAAGTLLYDVHERAWANELWELCGASPALAPDIGLSTEVVGRLLPEAARATGLTAGTPVVAGAGDVAAAALGAGAVRSGCVYVNTGTAAQVMAPLATAEAGPLFLFGQAGAPGFLVMASVYAAGMSVRWAEKELLGGSGSAGDEGLADLLGSEAPPGAGGLVYLPFMLGSSAPTHDDTVRAAFLGQGPEHGRAHVARAVVEGVAFGCLAAVDEVAKQIDGLTEIRVGGGVARSALWRDTVVAVAGGPVYGTRFDASPLGAALLAGVGIGVWDDVDEASRTVTVDPLPVPPAEVRERCRQARARHRAAAEAVTAFSHTALGGHP